MIPLLGDDQDLVMYFQKPTEGESMKSRHTGLRTLVVSLLVFSPFVASLSSRQYSLSQPLSTRPVDSAVAPEPRDLPPRWLKPLATVSETTITEKARNRPEPTRLREKDIKPAPVLQVPFIRQEERKWCTVASVLMAYSALKMQPPQKQCDVARKLIHLHSDPKNKSDPDCCGSLQVPPACKEAGANPNNNEVGQLLAALGIKAKHFHHPLDPKTLNDEITANRPVLIGLQWVKNPGEPFEGHIVVFRGFERRDGILYTKINDPIYGEKPSYDPKLKGDDFDWSALSDKVGRYRVPKMYGFETGVAKWVQTWIGLEKETKKTDDILKHYQKKSALNGLLKWGWNIARSISILSRTPDSLDDH